MKTIKLKSNGLGRYDDVSPFIIANENLELKIELPETNGEFFFIGEINGKRYKKLLSRDKTIELEGLTAGELQAEIKHCLKGVLIKTYTVEPILIREVDGSLKGIPEIAELRQRINNLENVQAELIKELKAQNKKLDSSLAALIRFSFADYKNNIYLSGGSLEQFIEEFGFELSEKEIKEIFNKE